jgi:AcrR family transcriptional regulator
MCRHVQADVADGSHIHRARGLCLHDVLQADDGRGGIAHLAQSPDLRYPAVPLSSQALVPRGTLRGNLMSHSDASLAAPAAPSLRDRIVGAAFSLFMERGYSGTSTSDIARRAHVSKRDLYALFGSKQAMMVACIAERTERMKQPLNLPVPASRTALVTTLMAFGSTLLLEVCQPEVLATHRLAIAESDRAPELAQTLDDTGRAGNFAALTSVVSAAQARGLLRASADPEEIADVFLAVLWRHGLLPRMLLRVSDAPDVAEREQRARFATETVMRLYTGAAL